MRFADGMCDIVAVCDVDEKHREHAHQKLTGGKGGAFNHYHDIISDDEIDVVYIATPDHWHAKILIEAMKAGKDVYCEKPLTLTIDEGKQIRRVQQETGKVVQVGTMQRSFLTLFVKAVAMCGDGRLGKIHRVTATIGATRASGPIPVVAPPQGFDWDLWNGPAPQADFRLIPKKQGDGDWTNEWRIGKTNTHQDFRHWFDYSGGLMTDWGAHHVDIACWALRAAGQSDTLATIGGEAKFPVPFQNGYPTVDDQFNTASSFSMTAMMTDGTELVINSDGRNGVLIEGENGRMIVTRETLAGKPVDQLADDPLPAEAIAKTYKNLPTPFDQHKNHWANFFHCIGERIEPISDVTSHLRAIDICHLANISARFQRSLKWDAAAEAIVDDDEANSLLSRPYRTGFEIG